MPQKRAALQMDQMCQQRNGDQNARLDQVPASDDFLRPVLLVRDLRDELIQPCLNVMYEWAVVHITWPT
jgi:hypothetical protein